jgi:hypothetical protein
MGLLYEALRAAPPTIVSTAFPAGAAWTPQKATINGTSSSAVPLTVTSGGFFTVEVESPVVAEATVDENNLGVFIVFGASDVGAATSTNGERINPGQPRTYYFPTHCPGTAAPWYFRAIAAGSEDSIVSIRKTGD